MPDGHKDLTIEKYKNYVEAIKESQKSGELKDLDRWSKSYDKYREGGENALMSTMLAIKDEGVKGFYQVQLQNH